MRVSIDLVAPLLVCFAASYPQPLSSKPPPPLRTRFYPLLPVLAAVIILFRSLFQRLLTLPNLRGSELLFHFLTSDLELSSSLLPDINIGEVKPYHFSRVYIHTGYMYIYTDDCTQVLTTSTQSSLHEVNDFFCSCKRLRVLSDMHIFVLFETAGKLVKSGAMKLVKEVSAVHFCGFNYVPM